MSKTIVALDFSSKEEVVNFLKQLDEPVYVKIGMECDLRQNHFYALDNTETATPSYTLLNASMGTDIKCRGKKILSVYLTGDNLTNRAYQNNLSRLKYAGLNPVTGREGVFNMGRNFGIKVVAPINL